MGTPRLDPSRPPRPAPILTLTQRRLDASIARRKRDHTLPRPLERPRRRHRRAVVKTVVLRSAQSTADGVQ